MNPGALFGNWKLHLGWTLASAVGLLAAQRADPYLFGLAAFCAAFVSCLLVLGTMVWRGRRLHWAVLACLPTMLAFMLLSTYKWA
jgi:hypothetical protein